MRKKKEKIAFCESLTYRKFEICYKLRNLNLLKYVFSMEYVTLHTHRDRPMKYVKTHMLANLWCKQTPTEMHVSGRSDTESKQCSLQLLMKLMHKT